MDLNIRQYIFYNNRYNRHRNNRKTLEFLYMKLLAIHNAISLFLPEHPIILQHQHCHQELPEL